MPLSSSAQARFHGRSENRKPLRPYKTHGSPPAWHGAWGWLGELEAKDQDGVELSFASSSREIASRRVADALNAVSMQEATREQTFFAETAYWNPRVQTGPDGRAQIQLSLPHARSQWTAYALAITRDGRVGVTSANFQVGD